MYVEVPEVNKGVGSSRQKENITGLVNLNKIETRKSNFPSINNVLAKLE